MFDDGELEFVPPKRTSKIAEPVRAPATFARKVSAPPTSVPSFGTAGGRKPTSFRASRTHAKIRTVGPTRTRNRFSAAYEDDEPDDVDDLAALPEEPPKDKESISGLPMFEAPSGFSFAPVRLSPSFSSNICNALKQPSSVSSIPQASDTPSVHDEPPITTLPFTFSKVQVQIPSGASSALEPVAPTPQPPAIALVPPTPDRPLAEESLSESALPNFFANSQIFARTGVPPPQTTELKPVSQPASGPDAQLANQTSQASEFVSGPAASESQTVPTPPASVSGVATPLSLGSMASPDFQKPTQPAVQARAPSIFGPPLQAQSMSTSSTQSINTSSLPFSLTPSSTSQPREKKDASPAPQKPLFGGTINSFSGFGTSPPTAPVSSAKPQTQSTEVNTHAFSFPKATTPAPVAAEQPLKPALPVSSPALTSTSLPATASVTEKSKPPLSAPFSFSQSTKESATPAPVPPATPSKSLFSFEAPSATPTAPVEKSGAAPGSFSFGSTPPISTPSGFLFGSPAAQSEKKPATGSGFSFGTPGPTTSDTSKLAFSFGTSSPARPLTPPPAEDGMRMEESPTRGGGIDASGGSAKPQSLPQLQMPGKSGFSFGSSTGAGFGSPAPSPFVATPATSFAFGQQTQAPSQGTSGGFAFGANPKSSEGATGGFSFGTTKPAESTAPTGFTFGPPATESRPSSSSGFAFNQPGPKTADAASSGFSFKAPESIQHSTSFTFGQTAPEPAPASSSSGFAFGQAQAQTPATATPFTFGSSVSGSGFGSAPASPAFGTQSLAPTSSAPFSFGGPTSAPPQQPAPNPFGFGSGAGLATSPAVQQGFGFNFGGGTPQTPTGAFGPSAPQTPTTGNSGNPVFTMGGAPPSTGRPVRKLPRRPNAKR